MLTTTDTTFGMNVINSDVVFPFWVCLGIIDNEGILLFFKQLVKTPQLLALVEENDHLQFVL